MRERGLEGPEEFWKRTRAHVERLLAEAGEEPVARDEWHDLARVLADEAEVNANGEIPGTDESLDFARHTVFPALRYARARGDAATSAKNRASSMYRREPPEWWRLQCERLFRAFDEDRRLLLASLGLAGSLDEREAAIYLGELYRDQARLGKHTLALLPRLTTDGRAYTVDATVWRGWSPGERTEEAPVGGPAWLYYREQPLSRVVLFAREITAQLRRHCGIACVESDAILYILTGAVPVPSWVDVRAHWVVRKTDVVLDGRGPHCHRRDKGARFVYDVDALRFTIEVASPDAPPSEVAAAYREARDLNLGRAGRQRQASPWPLRLAAEAETYEAEHGRKNWTRIFERFCARYPGHPYRDARSAKSTYHQLKVHGLGPSIGAREHLNEIAELAPADVCPWFMQCRIETERPQ